jgi:hypothetical protein
LPHSAADVITQSRMRLLVLGDAKIGKSCAVIPTSPKPVYVINSDDPSSLVPVQRRDNDFKWDMGRTTGEMEECLREARLGVRKKRYRTIVWDTISNYAMRLEQTCMKLADNDGRRAWPEYEKRLRNVIDRLFDLDAHVIVISHYAEEKAGVDGNPKSGTGILPLIAGKSQKRIPALFPDVVFMEVAKGDKRIFVVHREGVWGPGCRNLEGVSTTPANVRLLAKRMGFLGAKPSAEEK